MLLIALVLGAPEVRKISVWHQLAGKFHKKYRPAILDWYGYNTGWPAFTPVDVAQPKAFTEICSRLVREGVVSNCSYNNLAALLTAMFATGRTVETLSSELRSEANNKK